MKTLTCTQAKQMDLVAYLQSLGHSPVKVRGNDHWYLSPLREEKTASFKVDRKLNLWYDHGSGQGGDLVDFGTLYFNCSVSSLLSRLSGPMLSFQPPTAASSKQPAHTPFAGEKKEAAHSKILILSSRPLTDKSLLDYLHSRSIPQAIADRYCREIDFSLYEKRYKAIGFANHAGGHELRNSNFKGSSSPKAVTFMDNKAHGLAVFEGFFNFLSYVSLYGNSDKPPTNYLVLNSLAFFEKSFSLMQRHETINLYLDRDAAGKKYTAQALQTSPRFKDDSFLYEGYKDLNELLIRSPSLKKESKEEVPGITQAKEVPEQKGTPREQLPPFGKGRRI